MEASMTLAAVLGVAGFFLSLIAIGIQVWERWIAKARFEPRMNWFVAFGKKPFLQIQIVNVGHKGGAVFSVSLRIADLLLDPIGQSLGEFAPVLGGEGWDNLPFLEVHDKTRKLRLPSELLENPISGPPILAGQAEIVIENAREERNHFPVPECPDLGPGWSIEPWHFEPPR
jgi:hypothetical protein